MKGEKKPTPWWVSVIAALILCLHMFGDQLADKNLILIPIILLFVFAFGALLWLSIKQWKKPDQEIVSDYLVLSASLFTSDTKETKPLALRFLASAVFAAFVLIRFRDGSPAPFIFCGIVLVVCGFPLLGALLGWNRNTSDEQAYREGALVAVLIGIVTCGFFCFFIGIGIWHGVWWFTCPPGLIFLSLFSRPLVAGLRILFRKEQDPGEKHINKRKDIDPWDRPDRKL